MHSAHDRKQTREVLVWLIRFSLPLVLSGILQQLYSWADAFIVGNVEGMEALAAVGSTTAIVNFFVSLITGFTLGLGVLFAQKYGAEETKEMHEILGAFAVIFGLVFVGVAVLGSLFTERILILVDTDADSIDFAYQYLRVVFVGMPFLAVYNVFSAALRGLGNTRAPFYAVVISCCLNVVLDFLLVGYFRLGVAGAAWATIVSQCVMAVFIISYAFRKYKILRFRLPMALSRNILREGGSFGAPPMIQSSLTSFGSLILQRFMNGFGSATVAAITTSYRVDSVILLPILYLGSAVSTLTAQRVGAGDFKSPGKVYSTGSVLMIVVSLLLTLLVLYAGAPLISIFGVDAEALATGSEFFAQLAPFYIVFGLATAARGYLEGIADLIYSSAIGVLCLVFRIVCSYALADVFREGIFAYAEAFSWILLLALYLARTAYKLRRAKE